MPSRAFELAALCLHGLRERLARPIESRTSAILRMTPVGMLGHIVNVTIACIAFADSVGTAWLAAWAAGSYAIAVYFLYVWIKRSGADRKPGLRHPRATLRANLRGAALSLPWAVLGYGLLGHIPKDQELILIALCIGMPASGGVMLSAIFSAALAYMMCILGPLALKCFLLEGREYHLFGCLLLCYSAFLVNCINSCNRLFGEKTKALEDLEKSLAAIEQAKSDVESMAMHDALTGLPNRRQLHATLERAIGRTKRYQRSGAVLFLDLDRFKAVNDSLGHPAGDELLFMVATRLRSCLRESDNLARLGGDEFVVVLEGLETPTCAAKVAQIIIKAIDAPFILTGGHEVCIGTSIGISLFPNNATDPNEIIQHADTALYQAKQHGRGIYRFYVTELSNAANERLETEARMRRAIERCEFVLHYQPIMHIPTGRVTGVEALVRWNDPVRGLVSPASFISLAEDTGLIIPLGDWVLQNACHQMMTWLKAGYEFDTIAINLSPRQFRQVDLRHKIFDILNETKLPPHLLELELTEGALMERGKEAERKLMTLKGLGIRLSIDDFGTGYSSLAYLKRFPIDKLKIDRDFIKDVPGEMSANEIATAIIALGRTLDLGVLAEGIETEEQVAFLKAHGCALGQGAIFSPALPADDLEKWMLNLPKPRTASFPMQTALAVSY